MHARQCTFGYSCSFGTIGPNLTVHPAGDSSDQPGLLLVNCGIKCKTEIEANLDPTCSLLLAPFTFCHRLFKVHACLTGDALLSNAVTQRYTIYT